jgi:hypothetical protein
MIVRQSLTPFLGLSRIRVGTDEEANPGALGMRPLCLLKNPSHDWDSTYR